MSKIHHKFCSLLSFGKYNQGKPWKITSRIFIWFRSAKLNKSISFALRYDKISWIMKPKIAWEGYNFPCLWLIILIKLNHHAYDYETTRWNYTIFSFYI
jgi:hypothetical protein